ncbi:MAG TPA: ABC transporter ATP-binding protein [Alphaproteobacteria bacterium]
MTGNAGEAPLLVVDDLSVTLPSRGGPVPVLDGVGFSLGREKLGLVGESGAGKSTVGRALLGLLPAGAGVRARRIALGPDELAGASPARLRQFRGRRMAMILQDARHALDPVMTVGAQIAEAVRAHARVDARAARQRGLALLESVHVADAARVWRAYPHELSGGLGQRAMIAMMLAAEPEVLIADEPTSALDVIARAGVLRVLDELVAARGMGLLLISHDLHLVGRFCDRVLVMQAGRIVEALAAGALDQARHPYTRALLAARPRLLAGAHARAAP